MDTRVDGPVTPDTRPDFGRGRSRIARTIAAVLAAMVLCRPMLAAPPTPAEDFWTFPEGSAAFFAFDPRALGDDAAKDPNRALVEAGLRTLLDHITPVDGGGLPLPSGILNLGTLGASPYRICLMEIAGSPRNGPPSPDRPFGIEKLAAIMEIRVPAAEHDQLIGAIRGALDRDPRRAIPGAETTTTLPGGRKGTQFSRAGDPEWREISWCSTPTGLLVGMGHGSISRWLSTPPYAANQYPEWYAHRVSVTKARGPTNTVLEAMIDASALRRSLPEEFAFGRLGRLAEAWHLPNAREIMLHVRIPRPATVKPGEPPPALPSAPLLLVDLSYSSRAEAPPACTSVSISSAMWPAGIAPTPPAAPYSIVLPSDWSRWVALALDTWVACSPRAGLEANAAAARWKRPHAEALERASQRCGPYVVINGPAPGLPTLEAPLKANQPVERTVADLREMFAPFPANIRLEGALKTWTFRLDPGDSDPDRLLSQFAWSVSKDGSALRGAWDPSALNPAKPGR